MSSESVISMPPADPAVVQQLRLELGCSTTLAAVLARRGVTSAVDAAPMLSDLSRVDDIWGDPLTLGDMAAAVERITFAIEQGETIFVHGDYDADGVCSTTMLVEALEALGGIVHAFLPDRFSNGYGLQLETVELAASAGARLLITVDCGITAVEQVAHARDLGMDAIILDHHQPGEQLPDAIICSTRPSSYRFPELCATAVAGKLVQALGAPYGDSAHELEAIATIADCMPLVDENRALVQRGLRALQRTERPGLRALMSACDIHPRDVDAEAIGFRIAPRINAVGRIAHPDRAFELLRASDATTATAAAAVLHDANQQRRDIEAGIVAEAQLQIEGWSDEQRAARIWVVSGPGWHEGVVGIVASRIVERWSRPVIVLGEHEPLARGSGRSMPGIDLHAAISAADDITVRSGGHQAAIGLTVEPHRIPELRERLAQWGLENIDPALLAARARADAVLLPDELEHGLVAELAQLAPFGTGNERPRLHAVAARVLEPSIIGADKRHLRCRLDVGNGATAQVIAFGQAHLYPDLVGAPLVDACVVPSINRYRGVETLQLEAQLIVPRHDTGASIGECTTSCGVECTDRVPVADVIARSLTHDIDGAWVPGETLPTPEALLAIETTLDIRHVGRGEWHAAHLVSLGASVLVVVGDVSRRRVVARGALAPGPLGARGVLLASSRCADGSIGRRYESAPPATGDADAPVVIIADHGALSTLGGVARDIDVVVVLDPPTSHAEVTSLTSLGLPLHLAWSAAEQRFSSRVAAATIDIRGTLGTAWSSLLDGVDDVEQLDTLLFGAGEHLHAPLAVVHALASLRLRGLIDVDASRTGLTARNPAASPA